MTLPVAVIGAGPVGLAAAAHLRERGIPFVVLEQGATAGDAVRRWGHIRLFSPWEHVVDRAAVRLLGDWQEPATGRAPTGAELRAFYLLPLAASLGESIRYDTRVLAVSRDGMDRTRSTGRAETPFMLALSDGSALRARAVIDASGTFDQPNPALASGLAAHVGAPAMPDVLGADRPRFAGRHTVVVGSGHSAANTLIALATLALEEPATTVTWVIRSSSPSRVYGAEADALEGRASLGSRLRSLVDAGRVTLVTGFAVERVEGAVLHGRDGATIAGDELVVATGFRPDLSMLREIRLDLDEVVEAPRRLAPLIDPNLHSCGTVPPHGIAELRHPEPDFFLAGMKSYGRAPTFLLLTGYEQVRSIVAHLAGDVEAASRIDLLLPVTGVCSTDESSCCA